MHWFLDPITKHYADFSGRASRKQYWMFLFGHTFFIFGAMFFGITIHGSANHFTIVVLMGLFLLIWLSLFFVPLISIQVRRLHDIGLSGWWYFLGFIPYIGTFILLIMSCLQSEQKTNKYGPNPYGVLVNNLDVPRSETGSKETTTTSSTTVLSAAPTVTTPASASDTTSTAPTETNRYW